jgi:hypothetical protein
MRPARTACRPRRQTAAAATDRSFAPPRSAGRSRRRASGRAPVRRCRHPTDSLPITADHRGVPHSRNGIHLRQLPNQVPVDPGAYVHGSQALPGVQRVVARCDGRSQVERIRRGECVNDRCRDQRAGRRRLDRSGPGVATPRSPDGTLTRPWSGAPAARRTGAPTAATSAAAGTGRTSASGQRRRRSRRTGRRAAPPPNAP